MGVLDELLREKQVIKRSQTYVYPDQVGATEIGSAGMGTADIADGIIDEDKIAAAATDSANGVDGGGGTVITLDPDTTSIEFDGGAAGAKKIRVVDNGITAGMLGAGLAGAGASGGSGAAIDLAVAATDALEVSGGNLQVKDGGVAHAHLASDIKIRRLSVQLSQLVAGSTVRDPVMVVPTGKAITITKATIAAYTAASDANGTITGDLKKYDGAETDIVAAHDLETTAKTGSDMTIITAASANVLTANDQVYFESTANNEGADGIDANWVAPVLTIEYYES